jgi:hypothetical protein
MISTSPYFNFANCMLESGDRPRGRTPKDACHIHIYTKSPLLSHKKRSICLCRRGEQTDTMGRLKIGAGCTLEDPEEEYDRGGKHTR